jgi:SAM-dependent methyltransferase
LLVRYADGEMGVRCLRCRATPVSLSLIDILEQLHPDIAGLHVYELSSRGPVVRYLRRNGAMLTVSEFFDDMPSGGSERNGVPFQDVMALSFADNRFDLCTSTEVFEHVPDDALGFREIRRVLKPGGCFAFTVPMSDARETVTRAVAGAGGIVHRLPPEYHGDRIRRRGALCYRNYGADIVDRLRSAGFDSARLVRPAREWCGFSRVVVVARKAGDAAGKP